MRDDIFNKINMYVQRGKQVADETAIFFVANIKDKTQIVQDYSEMSIVSEFYTLDEVDEILNGFRIAGFFSLLFVDEDNFIQWIYEGKHKLLDKTNKCVYFTAQNGIGPARRSLISSFCSLHSIKILSSDAHVCSITRHKFHLFSVLNYYGVNCGRFWVYHPVYAWLNGAPPAGIKVIVKPIHESSCIGISENSCINYNAKADEYIKYKSNSYKQPMLIQEFVSGYEIEIPVFGLDKAMAPLLIGTSIDGEKFIGDRFLTYDRVYNDNYGYFLFELDDTMILKNILGSIEKAFKLTGMQGICRFDIRMDEKFSYTIIDATSHPHLIKHSSSRFLFESIGLKYTDIFAFLVGMFS